MKKKRKWGLLLMLSVGLMLSGGCGLSDSGEAQGGVFDDFSLQDIRDLFPKELEPVAQTDGVHQEYYFKQLTEDEQRSYRELLTGFLEFEEEIYLNSTDAEGIDRSFRALLYDHPEIFWVHNGDVYYKAIHRRHTIFTPAYSTTAAEAASVQARMEEAYQEITASLSAQAGEYEKVRAVYDYVIEQTDYRIGEHDQNLIGVFQEGQAVCAGYSGAVQYLLERMEIESIYVSGDTIATTQGHAWNIVKMDGQYYYVDATNGDQPEFLNMAQDIDIYDYLAPFPQEYEQICWSEDEFILPQCNAVDQNFYVRNGSCFEIYDFDTIQGYMKQQLDMGEHLIRFKFTNRDAYLAAVEDLLTGGRIEELAQYYLSLAGITQLEYHYNQIEDLYTIYFLF